MTVPTIAARSRPAAPAAVAGGLLAITLAAGCGSSGGSGSGSFTGPSASASATSTLEPPSSSASSAPQTESPFASTTPTASANALRDFHDAATGLSLSVPVGYVLATTPAEAAARFPAVLGLGSDVATRLADAESRLKSTTVMIAFHPPIGGVSDNVGLIKLANDAPSDPAEIQSSAFQRQVRTSLTGVGAKDIRFTETKVDGQPAQQVDYAITPSNGATVFGRQFYLAVKSDVFVVTVTAGTAARAAAASDFIAASWHVT